MERAVEKIERVRSDHLGWYLRATLPGGKTNVFGHGMTETGSKRMLTRRAKQFGLIVNGNTAE